MVVVEPGGQDFPSSWEWRRLPALNSDHSGGALTPAIVLEHWQQHPTSSLAIFDNAAEGRRDSVPAH